MIVYACLITNNIWKDCLQDNFYACFIINIREGYEPSAFEVEMANRELKRHKSPGSDQIQAELIIAGGRLIFLRSLNILILYGIERNA
jgi:hypothetical protein